MTMRDQLVLDLDNMEDAAAMTAGRCDIWQDRLIYNICVAVLHIIQWILKKETR